jgi:pimeloyl-ACP methyl ester carboxylesterase
MTACISMRNSSSSTQCRYLRTEDQGIDEILAKRSVRDRRDVDWSVFNEIAQCLEERYAPDIRLGSWDYLHPSRLQPGTPDRFKKLRRVRSFYSSFGAADREVVLCLGGIANVARRFDWLGQRLRNRYRVLAMDWVGRGRSGWLPEQGDYGHETHIEQVLQFVAELGLKNINFIGSSLGGTIALSIAARRPELVRSLILNDIGPFIPAQRRSRRAQSVARHYVFRHPLELFTRTGAAQKNDGPVDDATLLYNSFHMTKWSDDEAGRIYRYDPRALAAYRGVAACDLDQWEEWGRIRCPVLVLHGLCSDALLPATVDRMIRTKNVDLVEIPMTGHTPTLSDHSLVDMIGDWLLMPANNGRCTRMPAVDRPCRALFSNGDHATATKSMEVAA